MYGVKHRRRILQAALIALSVLAQPVAAQSLRAVASVDEALFQMSLAYSIQKNCPALRPRLLRALGLRNRIKADARAQGFTNRQIEDHVDSNIEQARMQARVDAYLVAAGYQAGSQEGYCAVGAAEISKKTQAGRLLR